MTPTIKKAYGLYFNREVDNLDKNYVPRRLLFLFGTGT